MIISQHYKIVNKLTQEVTIFEGEDDNNNYTKAIAFLQQNNALPHYKSSYQIFFCHESINIIDGVETQENEEVRLDPIFLVNKNTKEVIQCNTMPMVMQFIADKNIADYDFIYDEEVDNSAKLNSFNQYKVLEQKKSILKELEKKYNQSKITYVNNGNSFTLTVEHEKYNLFRNIVETQCISTTRNSYDKVKFFFVEDGYKYSINLMSYVWRYVFYPTQQNRVINKEKYDTYLYKINNSKTNDELTNLQFDFDFPNGFIVDVNVLTQDLLSEIKTKTTKEGVKIEHPIEVIQEMKSFLTTQNEGEIHLVKKELI